MLLVPRSCAMMLLGRKWKICWNSCIRPLSIITLTLSYRISFSIAVNIKCAIPWNVCLQMYAKNISTTKLKILVWLEERWENKKRMDCTFLGRAILLFYCDEFFYDISFFPHKDLIVLCKFKGEIAVFIEKEILFFGKQVGGIVADLNG